MMNVAIVCSIVAACVAYFIYFHIYRGVHGNLASADIGDVLNFCYVQPLTGEYERYLAKVVNIRTLDKFELGRLNITSKYRRFDDMFERSKTLVTCLMKDGTFRNFYGERTDRVYRPFLGKSLFRAGVVHLF
jgi:hypothetical protein